MDYLQQCFMHLLKLNAGLLFCFIYFFNDISFGLLIISITFHFYLEKTCYIFVSKSKVFNENHPCLLLAVSKYLPGFCFFSPRQQSAEDLARVPANSTSNILNRLLVSYDPRIRPNFKGLSLPRQYLHSLQFKP